MLAICQRCLVQCKKKTNDVEVSLRCSHIAESLCKRGYYKGVAIEMFSYGMMHLVWASLFPSDF